jgi:hypothetical protein
MIAVLSSALLRFAALSVMSAMSVLSGELPPQLEANSVTRVVFLPADDEAIVRKDCALQPPRGWLCGGRLPGDVGVVLFQAGSEIGFVALGLHGVVSTGVARWGRLIRVVPAVEADEVSAGAFILDRPGVRPNTRTLSVATDGDTHVWPLSPSVFWVAGMAGHQDAFIRFEAKSSARHDEPLERVMEGAPDTPLIVALQVPLVLNGRVESSSGSVVSGALVDVFARRPGETAEPTLAMLNAADVVRVAERRTDADGAFAFDGLEAQLYKVTVVDFERGRGEQWTNAAGPPIVVRLKTPSKATGRVLRHKLPVPGVVVRFVPDADAWRESRDPTAQLTLDVSTDDDGKFVLTLPSSAEGSIRLAAADGATRRIPLPRLANVSEIALGDVVLEELIQAEIQTDLPGCVLSAVGPVGAGFTIVRARSAGIVHSMQLPEAGQWLMQIECGGVPRRVSPQAIEVSAKGELSTYSLHVLE